MAKANPNDGTCVICGAVFRAWGKRVTCSIECRRRRQSDYYKSAAKTAPVSHEVLTHLLEYNPDTGLFINRVDRAPGGAVGEPAGSVFGNGYLAISIQGRRYYAHRLAWFYAHRVWPLHEVDHINGDRLDNRLCNLRDLPKAVNRQNIRAAQRDNALGLLGVSKKDGKFAAQIHAKGRRWLVGMFDTPEEAHAAYREAKRRLHEGCTI
jgi:hypothetical protein